MGVTPERHVMVVAWILAILGAFNLFLGFLAAGAALMGDAADRGQAILAGPALLGTGLVALLAGRRNRRLEGWSWGVTALLGMGGIGLAFGRPVNPYTLFALYGLVVYLSRGVRAAFRRRARELAVAASVSINPAAMPDEKEQREHE
jgi:hypothetical protein